MSVSVVLLAYMEAENLKILLPKIHSAMKRINEEYEIIVIDSAEKLDNTDEVCAVNGAKYFPQKEPYYAGAFKTGINYASMDQTLVLDADGSHDPASIPAIYKKFINGYDIVIGSRYTEGGISHDSGSSIIMSKILNTVMRTCLGIKAHDISTSFRMYDTKQLKNVTLIRKNYDVLQEVILRMKINKRKNGMDLRIGEVPITFNKRVYGHSKRKLIKFIFGYVQSLFLFMSLNIKSMISNR